MMKNILKASMVIFGVSLAASALADTSASALHFIIDWHNPRTLNRSFSLGCGVTKYGNNPAVYLTVPGQYHIDFEIGSETYYRVRLLRVMHGSNGRLSSLLYLDQGRPSDNDVNINLIELGGSKKEARITIDSGC